MVDNQTSDLIGMMPFVSGMPVVIKSKDATELGVCTRCEFVRLVLNKNETFDPSVALGFDTAQPHFLRYMPLYAVVKIKDPKFKPLSGFTLVNFPFFQKLILSALSGLLKGRNLPVLFKERKFR